MDGELRKQPNNRLYPVEIVKFPEGGVGVGWSGRPENCDACGNLSFKVPSLVQNSESPNKIKLQLLLLPSETAYYNPSVKYFEYVS